MSDLEKRVGDLESEILNIKVNYLSTIIIVIGYMILKGSGGYTVFDFHVSENVTIISFSLFVVLFFIKDFIKYTKFIIKKILLGGK